MVLLLNRTVNEQLVSAFLVEKLSNSNVITETQTNCEARLGISLYLETFQTNPLMHSYLPVTNKRNDYS